MQFPHREWQGSYIAALLAGSAIAIALPLLLNLVSPTLLEPVELWTVDLRFQHRPPLPVTDDPSQDPSSTLVAFDYDDRAAYDYGLGRWPWDRRIHAHALDLLSKSGARAVLVDLLFDYAASNPAEDKALVEATRQAGMAFYPIALRPAPTGEKNWFKPRKGPEIVHPIDQQGRTWINYAGPWGASFHHYPYSWVLDQLQLERSKASLPDRFKGKTVVLSNLTTGSGSRVATPFEGDFPSGEVHLHVFNMILRQQFLREATEAESALCLGGPVLLLTGAALAGGPWLVLVGFIAVLGGYLFFLQQVFNHAGVILPAVNPILALTFAPILLLVGRFLFVDRERVRFQSVLGGFLPPQTIRAIQQNPQTIPRLLAGRTRELTIFFADLNGFSAFCKRADPLQIQRILRDYLTAMTLILRGYGGTLDKYMGDGIMAFFGDAGAERGGEEAEEKRVERNAANAVRAGLAMQKKMTELNLQWISQGQEPHLIRIGINTGFVTVGNLGTEYLWDYTVIGPEVNKAQRLESAAEAGALLLARRTFALARNQKVLPDELPPCTFALKGIGEETDLYAVPAELVAQLAVSPPHPPERKKKKLLISLRRDRPA